VEKKDVEVSISNGFLTISGERKNISGEAVEGRVWQETSFGTFKRTFEVTEAVVEDKITAQFKNGILKISLPKAEEVKPSVINISVT
jgi:HSP20 family protein